MMSKFLKTVVVPMGIVFVCVFVACPSGQVTKKTEDRQPPTFQNEIPAARKRIHDRAKQAIPSLPDDAIVIGPLPNPRDRKNLTYLPSQLRVPRDRETSVAWISTDGRFSLRFLPAPISTGGWPFKEPEGDGGISSDGGPPYWAIRTVAADAGLSDGGRAWYHFQVDLALPLPDGGVEHISDDQCPPIIVE